MRLVSPDRVLFIVDDKMELKALVKRLGLGWKLGGNLHLRRACVLCNMRITCCVPTLSPKSQHAQRTGAGVRVRTMLNAYFEPAHLTASASSCDYMHYVHSTVYMHVSFLCMLGVYAGL